MCDKERFLQRLLRPHFLIGIFMGIGLSSLFLEFALISRESRGRVLGLSRTKRDISSHTLASKPSMDWPPAASDYEIHNLGLKLRSTDNLSSTPVNQNSRVINFNGMQTGQNVDYFDMVSESEFLSNDQAVREVFGRRLVYVGVMADQRSLSEQAAVIRMTWASEVSGVQFFFGGGTDPHRAKRDHVPEVVRLPDIRGTYGAAHTYQMLRHICKNFLDDYHWFVLVRDATYLHSSGLTRLLDRLVPSQDVVVGLPDASHACSVEAGMIFSCRTLSHLCPAIDDCSRHAKSDDASFELARCLAGVGNLRCVPSHQISPNLHIYVGDLKINAAKAVERTEDDTIFIGPMESTEDFYALQLHFTRRRIRKTQDEIYRLGKELSRTQRSILPKRAAKALELDVLTIFGGDPQINKSSEPFYQFIDSTGNLFLETCKVRKHDLGTRASTSYQKALLLAKKRMQDANRFLPSSNFESFAYKVDKPNIGVEYHFYFIEEITESPKGKKAARTKERVYQVIVQQAYGQLEVEYKETQDLKRVNFIVPTSGTGDSLKQFLHNYERVCLEPPDMKGRCSVVFVVFKTSKTVFDDENELETALSALYSRHPSSQHQVLNVQGESFTVARTIQMADSVFSRHELLAFIPTDVVFSHEFLYRCQTNSYINKRAYFPVAFQRYRQDKAFGAYSLSDVALLESGLSSAQGFWANSEFSIFCTYNEDLQTFYNLPSSSRDLHNIFKDSETMGVFRAPDPGLLRRWRKDLCSSESSLLRNDCIKEQKYMNMQ